MAKSKLKKVKTKKTHPLIQSRKKLTFSHRAADKMTEIFGSWYFILSFFIFLAIWMSINAFAWRNRWDPYPFILLNLILSCLAAIQAPIIMMTQNRQTERDRQAAKYDRAVNRKAEREIQNMQKDLDQLKQMIKKIT